MLLAAWPEQLGFEVAGAHAHEVEVTGTAMFKSGADAVLSMDYAATGASTPGQRDQQASETQGHAQGLRRRRRGETRPP